MAPKIVLLDSFTADQGDETVWNGLRRLGDVAVFPRTSAEELLSRLAEAEIALTNKVSLGAEVLASCPRLKYVGITATGTNVVDLEAARSRGVAVTNVPGYSTDSVAQLVFALILHFTHRVAAHDRASKGGAWHASGDFSLQLGPLVELAGKTLVVVGSGAIGSRVAVLAEAFGMRVLKAAVPGSPTGAGRVELTTALGQADYVTLHCPLTPATQRLVNGTFLRSLKPGALLINTGRGALVDEPALVEALASGRLAGAALDVLTEEPPGASQPLLDPQAPWSDRIVVTPHIGWATVEARRRLVGEAVENVRAYLAGEPRNRVV